MDNLFFKPGLLTLKLMTFIEFTLKCQKITLLYNGTQIDSLSAHAKINLLCTFSFATYSVAMTQNIIKLFLTMDFYAEG